MNLKDLVKPENWVVPSKLTAGGWSKNATAKTAGICLAAVLGYYVFASFWGVALTLGMFVVLMATLEDTLDKPFAEWEQTCKIAFAVISAFALFGDSFLDDAPVQAMVLWYATAIAFNCWLTVIIGCYLSKASPPPPSKPS